MFISFELSSYLSFIVKKKSNLGHVLFLKREFAIHSFLFTCSQTMETMPKTKNHPQVASKTPIRPRLAVRPRRPLQRQQPRRKSRTLDSNLWSEKFANPLVTQNGSGSSCPTPCARRKPKAARLRLVLPLQQLRKIQYLPYQVFWQFKFCWFNFCYGRTKCCSL